jgi:chromate transporter
MMHQVAAAQPAPAARAYRLRPLVLYFLRLGTLGFGGPVALVGYMHHDLVERRGWNAEADYKEGLALATAAILWRSKKVPEPVIVLAAALIGLVAYPVVSGSR